MSFLLHVDFIALRNTLSVNCAEMNYCIFGRNRCHCLLLYFVCKGKDAITYLNMGHVCMNQAWTLNIVLVKTWINAFTVNILFWRREKTLLKLLRFFFNDSFVIDSYSCIETDIESDKLSNWIARQVLINNEECIPVVRLLPLISN